MTNDGAHGFFGDGVDYLVHGGGELFDEVAHKFRNIRFSFAERWQRNWKNIQAIIQILPEFTVTDHLPQVLIGRRDDTNIDARGTGAAYGLELALLEHTEQFRLKLHWHVSDFIKKQCASVRQRKPADMRIDSSGKGSAFVPEKLTFEKAGRHRRTVHFDEIAAAARAELVNRARDNLLARPSFAGDQDGGVRWRHRLDFREDGAEAATAPHDCLEKGRVCALRPAHNWCVGNVNAGAHCCVSPVFVILCICNCDHFSLRNQNFSKS